MHRGPAGTKSLEARVAELEFLFTHLERQMADLGRVAVEQQARIKALETELRALQRARNAADEMPPDDDEEPS
jgi:uncharacterized coiled-coil protein SlyX